MIAQLCYNLRKYRRILKKVNIDTTGLFYYFSVITQEKRNMTAATIRVTTGQTCITALLSLFLASPGIADTSTNEIETTAASGSDEEITITAERSPVEKGERSYLISLPTRDLMQRPLAEMPGLEIATSVVGADEIEWLNAYSTVDALNWTPGAWTESRGRKVKQFFSVRGQRYPYPGYLIDNGWFREFHEINYYLDAWNFERIEVLRSSAALMLSPESMTGAINLVPRIYREEETRIGAEYGTDNYTRLRASYGTPVGDKTAIGGSVSFFHTDGPEDENARENIGNIYASLAHSFTDELEFVIYGFYVNGDRQLRQAQPPASKSLQTRVEEYDPIDAYIGVAKITYRPNDRATTEAVLNGAWRELEGHREGRPDWTERDYEYGARLTQSLLLNADNVLRFDGMVNRWKTPTGKRFYVNRPGDIATYSLAIADEQQYERWLIGAGYRYSRSYIKEFGGFNVEGSSAGLTSVKVEDEWEDPKHTLSLSAAYDLSEEYRVLGNFGGGIVGASPGMLNSDLQTPEDETRYKYDLGIRGSWGGFGEVILTGFFVDQHDAAVIVSDTVVVNGDDFSLYENKDRQSYGVELDIRSRRLDCGVQLFGNAVAMRARVENPDGSTETDEEVPDLILGGGISYLIGVFDTSVFAKSVSEYENDRFLPAMSEPESLGDFTQVDVQLSYFFGNALRSRAYVRVDNISDETFSTVNGYPDIGRQYKAGIELVF